jgi:hypothetical protein
MRISIGELLPASGVVLLLAGRGVTFLEIAPVLLRSHPTAAITAFSWQI